MIWMALLMTLPLLGLVLFFFYPWRVALLPYMVLVAVSLFFHSLMMRSMRLPVRSGREEMIGSSAVVLRWEGGSGQVIWHGEIWQAESREERVFMRGDRVMIKGLSGLTLVVKPAVPDVEGSKPRSGITF
jgi:membrane protein implicated in regulation of membrane protease activity